MSGAPAAREVVLGRIRDAIADKPAGAGDPPRLRGRPSRPGST